MVEIEINDKKYQAEPGEMIIAVTDRHQIHVPRFCYHKKLSIAANCRMCLVEVAGSRKTLPACATPVADGMKVYTKSKATQESQRRVMEFLLVNHPLDCPVCDQGGECELQDLSMGYGDGKSHFIERKRSVRDKNIGPLVKTYLTRCIQCSRCVRFGTEIAGLSELGLINRGEKTEIATFLEGAMTSEMSGNVIDVCPVGALTNKPFRFQARSWEMRQHEGVAPHDCLGSNLYVHTRGWQYTPVRHVMRTVPRENEHINETWLADRDRWSCEGINSDDRVFHPMIKRNGEWVNTDWQTALNFVADALTGIKQNQGADHIAAIAHPSSTVEEHYLLQKLMRGIGCQNIDHRIRQTDFSDQENLDSYPHLGCDVSDLEKLDAAFIIGANIRHEQPVAAVRLRKLSLHHKPIFALNPIAYDYNFSVTEEIVAAGAAFIHELAGVVKAAAKTAKQPLPVAWEKLLADIQVSKEHTAIATALINANNAAIILGAYGYNFPHSAIARALASLLAELTGASVGALTTGSNSAGAHLAGCLPHRLPGGDSLKASGKHVADMLAAKLSAYLLLNVEPESDFAFAEQALTALAGANLVVMMSPFVSQSMREYADVLLPVTPFTENEGHLVNANGQWQKNSIINPPQQESRPAWKVLRVLGNLLSVNGFDYLRANQVADELKQFLAEIKETNASPFIPDALPMLENGLTRLGEWPIYRIDQLVRRSQPLQQMQDIIGFAGVMIHPELAKKLQVNDGEDVTVIQAGQKIKLPCKIATNFSKQCVLLPMALAKTAGFGAAYANIALEKA